MKQFLFIVFFGIAVAASVLVWTRPRNEPIDASKVVEAAREFGAKAREAVSDAARPLAPQPHQDVYDIVCAKLREAIKTASTAKFAILGKDEEAAVEPLGRNVYRVKGFVDAQNLFGAMIRDNWSLSIQVEDGKIGKLFSVSYGEDVEGNPEDAVRVAKGLPTIAEEKAQIARAAAVQLRKEQQAKAVQMRIELHKVAQERIASDWKLPSSAKFSTLQAVDDQWTVSREIPEKKLWMASGVVEPKGLSINRLTWKSVYAVEDGNNVVVRFSQLGSRTMGETQFAALAKVVSGGPLASTEKQDGYGEAKAVADANAENARTQDANTEGWHMPRPPYPPAALASRLQGSGSVRISTDASGNVTNAVITGPINPLLDANTRSFASGNWKGPPNSTRTVPVIYQIRETQQESSRK